MVTGHLGSHRFTPAVRATQPRLNCGLTVDGSSVPGVAALLHPRALTARLVVSNAADFGSDEFADRRKAVRALTFQE
jgi:hypothetical protein